MLRIHMNQKIKKRNDAEIKHCNDLEVFMEYSNTMNDIYDNINDYNSNINLKILIVFDNMIAGMNTKKIRFIVKELFIRCMKLNASLIFIRQSYFLEPKNIRSSSTHYLIMKIHNKKDL